MPLINPSAPRPRNVDDGRKMRPKRKRDSDGGKTARGPRKAPKAHPKAESLPPVCTEDDLSVAQLQQSAALLPKPASTTPALAATLRLGADASQHANEPHSFFCWATPVLKGKRHQTRPSLWVAPALSRSSIRRSPASSAGPGPKPSGVICVSTLDNGIHIDNRTRARVMGDHVKHRLLGLPRLTISQIPFRNPLLCEGGGA